MAMHNNPRHSIAAAAAGTPVGTDMFQYAQLAIRMTEFQAFQIHWSLLASVVSMHFAAFGDRSADNQVGTGLATHALSLEKQESDVFRSHESVLELLRRDCSPLEQQMFHARSASLLSDMFDAPVVKELIQNLRASLSTPASSSIGSSLSSPSVMKLRHVLSHAACLRADLMLKTGNCSFRSKPSVAAAQLFQVVHRILVDAALLNPSNEDCRAQLCSLQYDGGNLHHAIEEARHALQLRPSSSAANSILFKSMFVVGQWSVCDSIWESHYRHLPLDCVPVEVQAMQRLMRCRRSSHYVPVPLSNSLRDLMDNVAHHCDSLLHPTTSHRSPVSSALRVVLPSVANMSSSQLAATLLSHWCSDDTVHAHDSLVIVSANVAAKGDSKQADPAAVILSRWIGPANVARRNSSRLFVPKDDALYPKPSASSVSETEAGDSSGRIARASSRNIGSSSSSSRLSARRASLNRPNLAQHDLLDDQARSNLGAGEFPVSAKGQGDAGSKAEDKDEVGSPRKVSSTPTSVSNSRRNADNDGRSGPSNSKLADKDSALMINILRECGYSVDDSPRSVVPKQSQTLQEVLCKWIQAVALQCTGLFYDHARLDVSSFTRDSLNLAPWVCAAFADFATSNVADAACTSASDDGRFICAAIVALVSSEAVIQSSDSIEKSTQSRVSLRLLRSAARALTSAITSNWHSVLQKSQTSHESVYDSMHNLQQLLAIALHCIDDVPDSPLIQRCRENNYSFFRNIIKRTTTDMPSLEPSELRISRTELLLDLPFECRLVAELVATTCLLISETINLKLADQVVIGAESMEVVCSDVCGRAARTACSLVSRSRSSVNFFIRGTTSLTDSADVLSGSVAQQILMSHGPSSSILTDAQRLLHELPLVWETLSSILRCSNLDLSTLKTQFQDKGADKYSSAFYKTVSEFPVPWKIWSNDCQKQTGLRPTDSGLLSPIMDGLNPERSTAPENCSFFAIESWCAAFHATCVALMADPSLSGLSSSSSQTHWLAIARVPLLMSLSLSILQLQLLVRSFPFELGDENLAQFTAAFASKPRPEALSSYVEIWNGERSGRSILCASLFATLFRIDEILERYFSLIDGHLPVLSSLVDHFSARSVGKCEANLAGAMAGGSNKVVTAEKAIAWAEAGLKAINFQSLRMLILAANNCIISCPSLHKLELLLPTSELSGGGEQSLAYGSVSFASAACMALLRLQQSMNISGDVTTPRDVVDSIFYCVDQLCECACASTYASSILYLRCFNHCGALRISWQSSFSISSPKRSISAPVSPTARDSSTFERGTRARVSARDSDVLSQEIAELQGHMNHLQLQCLVGIVGVSHQAPGRKSSSARITAPSTPLIGLLPLPLRCEVLREFVSKVEEEDCKGVGALLDRDSMNILLHSLQARERSVNSAKYEDALLSFMLPDISVAGGSVPFIASVDLKSLSELVPGYFQFDDRDAVLRLRPLPIECTLLRNASYVLPSQIGGSADSVVQNICAMKASSVDVSAMFKQKGRNLDSTGDMIAKKAGSGRSELRAHLRELISCALVSPRPLRVWRTIADLLSVQFDAHVAIGEVTHDFPAQSCAVGLLIAQLILLHLDSSRNNGFSSQAHAAILIARCLYFLSPAKIWTQDVLTFEHCFKPWFFSASEDPVHSTRRWMAALTLSWLRVAKACNCDEFGGCRGDLPRSILSTLPSDWTVPEKWTTIDSSRREWATAIATECNGVADDTNFPVSFARVVLFYAARMSRKLSASSVTVLQLLSAAHEIADPKDVLGPCDIDLPSTWLVLYQFKFFSALAFFRAGDNTLPSAEIEAIMVAGRLLSDELEKCKRIGKQIHIYGLIKQCAAFRALYASASIDWSAEVPTLHRYLINDKAARGQSGQPLIFFRPPSYAGRDWMRHIHFESSFRRMLGVYVACLRFAPMQDSMSICTRVFQRNMEQLRACTVNAAALLLDDAAKIDNSTHVPIIFKSDIDNCLYFEAVPLLNVHSRLRPCPAVDKRAIFGFGVCTDAAALQLPFEEHACRSLEQGMELRNASATPSRWFPATFIDASSMFEFPEEERLQLRMKFLYPEYLRSLSAVVDAAAPCVAEAQSSFSLESIASNPPPSTAIDAAEALLTQLVNMQVQARQMWQFASMLQFTDVSFSSESALRGIVLIVHSLTITLVAYGRASSAPWVEFLPPIVSSTINQMNGDSDDGIEAITAAAALKDNVLLIALNKCREAARNKARIEKLKAAQLARKAGAGAALASGGNCDTVSSSTVECVGVGAMEQSEQTAACADVCHSLPSSPAASQLETAAAEPTDLSHPDMLELEEADDGRPEHGNTAANNVASPQIMS